jgi:hypothetical protein
VTIPQAFLAIALLTLSLTVVFFAAHLPKPLAVKTAIAAVGFLFLACTLYYIGALG